MGFAHHRADQSLDMAAEPRRSRRPVGQIDAVLGAGPFQRQSVELGAVVDVNDARNPARRPIGGDVPGSQPAALVHHGVGQTQRHRREARRLEGEVKTHRHARGDIDRQGQRGTSDWPAAGWIDNGDVDFRVVDLDNVQRRIGSQGPRRRKKNRLGLSFSLSPAQQLRLVLQSQPPTKTADRRRLKIRSSTIGADLSP